MSATTPPGRRLAGRYALHNPVKQGTVGTVLRATDTMLRREVAVKEIRLDQPGHRAGRAGLHDRLLREVRAAARVVHQGVVTIFDVIEEAGRLYIVTELVPGRSLRDLVAAEGPLPADRVARLGATLLAALSAAHRRGLVHHDVQPGNVVVMPDGRVKLCELGVAFLRPGPPVGGTGGSGEAYGQDADLRALGATLRFGVGGSDGQLGRVIEALLGAGAKRPVRISALQDTLDQLGAAAPVPPSAERAVDTDLMPSRMPSRMPSPHGPDGGVAADVDTLVGDDQALQDQTPPYAPDGPPLPGPPAAAGARTGGWRANRAWWLPSTVLTLACVVLAVAAVGRAPARQSAAPPPPTTKVAPPGDLPPPGWRAFEDVQSGFGVAIPPGWELIQDRTGGLAFRDAATGSTARIQYTDAPAPQPDSEPLRSERTYVATGPYQRIRLGPTTFRGQPAAEWEFTFTRDGVDWHAADLYFIAGGRGYWLSFQTHDQRWKAAGPTLAALRDSFRLLSVTPVDDATP
jgi:hypothetical protein